MAEVEARPLGLRERKKQQTRQLIAETARQLFGERGFERVTVAEIARAADVSEQTVFNYFPTKEDLVFFRLGTFEDELLSAIRERAPGEPAVAAFRRFLFSRQGWLGRVDEQARTQLAAVARTIDESPALLAREEQIFARYTASLAQLLASEQDADARDVEPWVAANALMGVHRSLVAYARRGVLDGVPHARLLRAVRAQAERALSLLEDGLGDYGVRRG